MIDRLIEWWRRVTCTHPNRIARFRFEGEYGIGYWECPARFGGCGAEWEDD